MKLLFVFVTLSLAAAPVWCGGAAEGAAASDRGKTVAESGRIIPPEEIRVDSYISEIDYGYPDPLGDLGITLLSGHRQLSRLGQDELIVIGLQGRRGDVESLPPLNLALLLDASGSMSAGDKASLGRECLRVLLGTLRGEDVLSVIVMAGEPTILHSARPRHEIDAGQLTRAADSTLPLGATDLLAGLRAARDEVRRHYRSEGVNRIILVSDGRCASEEALQLATTCRKEGVSITTASVGLDADVVFMTNLAERGGGSSRFLPDAGKATVVFGTDLGRTVVPVAYDLAMALRCAEGVQILGTWGYEWSLSGNTVTYSLPALHHRDYETIVLQVRLPSGLPEGSMELARFDLRYVDRSGSPRRAETAVLRVEIADLALSSSGLSDPTVLKAGTILHAALGLREIGTLYPTIAETSYEHSLLSSGVWQGTGISQKPPTHGVLQGELDALSHSMQLAGQRCLDLSVSLAAEIRNTHLRLQEEPFTGVLAILTQYIRIIGPEVGLSEEVVKALEESAEIAAAPAEGPLEARLDSLVRELLMAFEPGARGTVLYGGFAFADGGATEIQRLLDGIVAALVGQTGLSRVAEADFASYLRRSGITLRQLADTGTALRAAAELGADYVLAGSLIRFPSSLIVFGRLLRRADASVVSVAQLVLPMDEALRSSLEPAAR